VVAVLLLNASYEPLYVIDVERAATLLLGGLARPVEGEPAAAVLHSQHLNLEVPVVISLQRYVNVPKRGATWSRSGVLQRDGYRCIYCGVKAGDRVQGRVLTRDDFSVDHVVPCCQHGLNTWGNTACACNRCNARKGGRTPHQAGMQLLWEPKTPRTNYLIARGNVPVAWKKYVEY
jgi:5-methylcytosine-specific restriction endonuclease McrA